MADRNVPAPRLKRTISFFCGSSPRLSASPKAINSCSATARDHRHLYSRLAASSGHINRRKVC